MESCLHQTLLWLGWPEQSGRTGGLAGRSGLGSSSAGRHHTGNILLLLLLGWCCN